MAEQALLPSKLLRTFLITASIHSSGNSRRLSLPSGFHKNTPRLKFSLCTLMRLPSVLLISASRRRLRPIFICKLLVQGTGDVALVPNDLNITTRESEILFWDSPVHPSWPGYRTHLEPLIRRLVLKQSRWRWPVKR